MILKSFIYTVIGSIITGLLVWGAVELLLNRDYGYYVVFGLLFLVLFLVAWIGTYDVLEKNK